MSLCRRCLVAGRVQGVFFRASTQRRAEDLGLTGHARNLPDGRVEVLACGAPSALEELEAWLWRGPSEARVEDVVCTETTTQAPPDFTTR